MSAAAAAAAAAAGGVANSLTDFAVSSIMANSANAKNKRAQERANWFNVYNWQLQNEYNLPKNQIKRLLDANLNPSMIYGNGSSDLTSGAISSPGSYNAYSGKGAMKLAENIAAVQALKQQQAGIDKTEAEIDSIDNGIAMDRARLKLEQELQPVKVALMVAQAFNQNQSGRSVQINNEFYDMMNEVLGGVDVNKDALGILGDIGKGIGQLIMKKKGGKK